MTGRLPDPTLHELRQEIARIDHAIILLVAARIRAARRAIERRSAYGESPTNRDQELVVRDRAREWAKQVAVPPEFAVHLIQALVMAGKEPSQPSAIPLPPLPERVTCRLGALTAFPPPQLSIANPAPRAASFRSGPLEEPIQIP